MYLILLQVSLYRTTQFFLCTEIIQPALNTVAESRLTLNLSSESEFFKARSYFTNHACSALYTAVSGVIDANELIASLKRA